MSDLRSKREAQTRADIVAAAIPLFVSKGFDATTMSEVAKAAGVSRRTAYRHFPNKEDLVFEHPRRWLAVLNGVLSTRKSRESTRAVCSRALLDVARFIMSQREGVLPAFSVVVTTPSLGARHARSNAEWLAHYVAVIAQDIPGDRDAAELKAAVIAGALVGGTDRALAIWATHPERDLVALTKKVLEQIEPIWPTGASKRRRK